MKMLVGVAVKDCGRVSGRESEMVADLDCSGEWL